MSESNSAEGSPWNGDPVVTRSPVGELVRTGVTRHGHSTATFDTTMTYRYRLSRVWDPAKPRVAFCMLNPSTADERILDPTVRRCWGYAQAWGAGSLEIVNAFALRSTDPKGLRAVVDPVGDGNDEAIVEAGTHADLLLVAWGTHAKLGNRHDHVLDLLLSCGLHPAYLHMSKDGYPKHPLYLPADTQPRWWPLPGT